MEKPGHLLRKTLTSRKWWPGVIAFARNRQISPCIPKPVRQRGLYGPACRGILDGERLAIKLIATPQCLLQRLPSNGERPTVFAGSSILADRRFAQTDYLLPVSGSLDPAISQICYSLLSSQKHPFRSERAVSVFSVLHFLFMTCLRY